MVWQMTKEGVRWLLQNNKTSLGSVHAALYRSFRDRFPWLHSQWVISAEKTATDIVHTFNKRKRKGKAKRPNLKKPFVVLSPALFKVNWNGVWLRIVVFSRPNDLEPIVFEFRVHSRRYREILDGWLRGESKLGQITLTPTSICLPLKFPDTPTYVPTTVIGVDSNENSLDCYIVKTNEGFSVDTSYVPKVCRDHERRIQKGTKGKNNPKAKRKIKVKHGQLRREKVRSFWHHLALWLIALAGNLQAALVLEDLKGMAANIARKQKSKRLRQRLLNFWSIRTFHAILERKAAEYGVPIVFVDPKGTSQTCPICGGYLRGQDKRCPSCGLNRHAVAAINIACRGQERIPVEGNASTGQGAVRAPRRLPSVSTVAWWQCADTAGTCV